MLLSALACFSANSFEKEDTLRPDALFVVSEESDSGAFAESCESFLFSDEPLTFLLRQRANVLDLLYLEEEVDSLLSTETLDGTDAIAGTGGLEFLLSTETLDGADAIAGTGSLELIDEEGARGRARVGPDPLESTEPDRVNDRPVLAFDLILPGSSLLLLASLETDEEREFGSGEVLVSDLPGR